MRFVPVWQGFVIMVICILIGLLLSMTGGVVVDTIVTELDEQGFDDVPDKWNYQGNQNSMVNLFYVVVYIIPLLGIIIFIMSVIARQQYDQQEAYY